MCILSPKETCLLLFKGRNNESFRIPFILVTNAMSGGSQGAA